MKNQRKIKFQDFMEYSKTLLFPAHCSVCDKKLLSPGSLLFCSECMEGINFVGDSICRVCGIELATNTGSKHLCGICLLNPPTYDLARSVVRYNSTVQRLLAKLKYYGDTTVIPALKTIAEPFDLGPFMDCDFVIPVPLHPARLRNRGINQSVLLAKIFFLKRTNLEVRTKVLVRRVNTIPQTNLDGTNRRINLKGAFAMYKGASVRGASVCLVDDVFTTGTTVAECSKVLCGNGAKVVMVLSLARAGYSLGGNV